jgi:Polyketide cyclase / dehydrase and lipid transport
MAVDVMREIVIGRPRAAVAAYMFDPRNDAQWTTGVVECRPSSEGRLEPGAEVERVSAFLGRRFSYVYEVVAADDDCSVDLTVAQPFPMQIRYELADTTDGTLARIQARGEAKAFFRLATPLLNAMVGRNIAKDLALLKRRLEAGA